MSGNEARSFVLEDWDLHLGYTGSADVVAGLDVAIETGSFAAIVRPSACDKSILLRPLSKVLPPRSGTVLFDGREIVGMRPKVFAREVGFLAQSSIAPEGITVHGLVSRGRYPHQSVLHQWSDEDDGQISTAVERTNVSTPAARRVAELSGGQRQRVWIAMALTQQTRALLLDEPTTLLDLAHQVKVLELCRELNQVFGTTVVAVLRDLNQACRYADRIIAMCDGQILTQGRPSDVVTAETAEQVFGLEVSVTSDLVMGTPLVPPAPPRTYNTEWRVSRETAKPGAKGMIPSCPAG